MKQNSLIILFVFFIASFFAKTALSQNYVEVGSGVIQTSMPVYSSWNYSWSSLIYKQSDLGTAKTITKIGLNCINGPKTVTNQKIYVKLSPNSVFANAGYEDPLNTGYTLVFQGTLTFLTGWNEILLTSPVVYDGVQNLIIHWENSWGTTYGPQFTSTASVINDTKNCGNDVNFPPPSQTGYLNPYPSSLTNMRFFYASSGPATPTAPVPSDNATVISVDTDLSWTLGANTTNYDLYFGTDPQNLPMLVSNATALQGINSYTVPGLLADSLMHYWKVVARNGTQQEASPVWKFKTEVVIDQFPYNESFEDSAVFHTYPVTSAWVINPDISWYEYDVNAQSGELCAKSSFYVSGNAASLRSPKVLLPPGYSISYYWRNTSVNKVAGHDTTFFEVSGNGGATWVQLDILSPEVQNPVYVQRTHNLNAYAGNNFYFRFRRTTDNSGSASNVYLDNISIFQSSASPTLLVTPANQNVSAPAGNTNFTVTSNSDWTVSSDQVWCTPTSAGSGNGSINAVYTENTSGTQRVATITVTVSGLSPVTVTVTQGTAAATLSVNPPNQNVTAAAGNTSFTVTSNSSWNAGSDQNWCVVTPSGTGNGNVIATYTENTGLTARIANITVTVSGLSPVLVTVTQEAALPYLSATPPNQEVEFQAGTTNFTVNSNVAWTASSDAGWCAVTSSGSGSGTIFANYAENQIATVRVAIITVQAAGLPPVTVSVTQLGPAAVLNVTPLVQQVTHLAGLTTFVVNTNTNWTAVSDAAWCQPTLSGTGSGVINVTYTQNESMVIRTAGILVSAPGVAAVSLQVIQLPSFVSVSESDNAGIEVYPNPASDQLNIYIHDIKEESRVFIYTLEGEAVFETSVCKTDSKINVSFLRKGTYVLTVVNGKNLVTKKLIII